MAFAPFEALLCRYLVMLAQWLSSCTSTTGRLSVWIHHQSLKLKLLLQKISAKYDVFLFPRKQFSFLVNFRFHNLLQKFPTKLAAGSCTLRTINFLECFLTLSSSDGSSSDSPAPAESLLLRLSEVEGAAAGGHTNMCVPTLTRFLLIKPFSSLTSLSSSLSTNNSSLNEGWFTLAFSRQSFTTISASKSPNKPWGWRFGVQSYKTSLSKSKTSMAQI